MEAHGLSELCKMGNIDENIPVDPTLIEKGSNTTYWESDDEYHDSLTDIKDLKEVLNNEKDPKDLNPEMTSIIVPGSETDEDDEYHDSLADIEDLQTH